MKVDGKNYSLVVNGILHKTNLDIIQDYIDEKDRYKQIIDKITKYISETCLNLKTGSKCINCSDKYNCEFFNILQIIGSENNE